MTDLPFLRLAWRHATVVFLRETRGTVPALHPLAVVVANDYLMAFLEAIVFATGAVVIISSFVPIVAMLLCALLLGMIAFAAFVTATGPLGLVGKRRAHAKNATDKQCK